MCSASCIHKLGCNENRCTLLSFIGRRRQNSIQIGTIQRLLSLVLCVRHAIPRRRLLGWGCLGCLPALVARVRLAGASAGGSLQQDPVDPEPLTSPPCTQINPTTFTTDASNIADPNMTTTVPLMKVSTDFDIYRVLGVERQSKKFLVSVCISG